MREIKFRAWGKDLGMSDIITLDELASLKNGTDFCEFDIYLQYTGLKDKNGKEIYEGDILLHKLYPHDLGITRQDQVWINYRNAGETEYDDDGNEYIHLLMPVSYDSKHGNYWPFVYGHSYYTQPSILEIVGNIYENPELLKENKE